MKKNISRIHITFLFLTFTILGLSFSGSAEPWKGTSKVPPYEFGVLTGFSQYAADLNWTILATGAYQLKEDGFADDIDDRVWIDGKIGPSLFGVSSGATGSDTQTALQWNVGLRWDFTYDQFWTFYGLGGLGGFVLPSAYGSEFVMHPRFGVGAIYQTKTAISFRGEVAGDLMAVGVVFNF